MPSTFTTFTTLTTCRAALLLLTLGSRAVAQREPATVPTELASVLLGGFSFETGMRPHFVVGRVPSEWPAALSPGAPWKTIGGVELGLMRVAVFDPPRGRDATADYDALLRRAGLKLIDLSPTRGGFTAEVSAPRAYCSDSMHVMLSMGDSTSGRRLLAVTVMRDDTHGCGDAPIATPFEPIDIPALSAPPGVSALRRGSASGGDYIEQGVEVDTTLSVAGLLDHYTRQLGAARWTIGRRIVLEGTGLQRLATRDRSGTEWEGALVVITTGKSRQVVLHLVKPTLTR